MRPTRGVERRGLRLTAYLALLQLGFAVPCPLPDTRWALTPPFHPYLSASAQAVCFLWHYPSRNVRAQELPGSLPVEPGRSSQQVAPKRDRPAGFTDRRKITGPGAGRYPMR